MADTKLSALVELAATPAVDDEVYIRDVSEEPAAESKRITVLNLLGSFVTHAALAIAHGAVSAATASKIVIRDASGRAKFAAPGAAGDVLIKGTKQTITELPDLAENKVWKGNATNRPIEIDPPYGVLDFWSDTQEELLINATAGDKALPDVVVAEVPGTIIRAIAIFKFRMVENVFAGANAINVAQHIQVRDDTPGTYRDAISIADNLFNFSEAAREGGDVLVGDHDIAVEVDGNGTYNFKWELADADQISINFNDIQVGLRIWYAM